jgi:hypothetical protein
LGSFFAGVKAGTLGGFLYVGGMAAFNVVLLYALKSDVLNFISAHYSADCPAAALSNSTANVQSCFASVVALDVPLTAFEAFFFVLAFAGAFGIFYDSIPTGRYIVKSEVFAAMTATTLFAFGSVGFFFDEPSVVASGTFLVAWTAVFGYFLGRLYKRYTSPVSIDSQDPTLLKVMVDGRDLTGKIRTFALTSSHKVRAEVTDDASFREWEVKGKLMVEDPRSFETVVEVNGEGSLKGIVKRKY